MGDEGGEGESVQVAVRMRVFNGREKAAGARRIVRMEQMEKGSKTFATNPDTEEEKEFKYDYSFQSHDESDDSIGKYCTQDDVFRILGRPVLGYALEGKNTCLFAYGQTGAGKSFSMLGKVGQTETEGIIPRTCKEIFKIMRDECNELVQIQVDIQVVEIYCEQINDLLQDRSKWPANGYKPRLTAKDGYVVDTTKKPCFEYEDIDQAMNFADKNRSVGSHALNPESSRAHTIYQINYSKVKKAEGGVKVLESIASRLNLVDLAGSERTDSAGTSGQMLKEGNAINLSLTALGSCIKALSEEKKPNFRDSKLTLLLQGSMTNGKVIMIAAVSPASICYAETVSTLRFADRIKQVKIKAKANVSTDPVAELKKEMEAMRLRMQTEIDALRGGIDPSSSSTQQVTELQRLLDEQKEAEKRMRDDFERQLRTLEHGDGDRRKQAAVISGQMASAFKGTSKAEREVRPHLVNLHEDERLAETLVYPFKEGVTRIGRSDKAAPPDLEFNGMGMLKGHCEVEYVAGDVPRVFLKPTSAGQTLVNGKKIAARTELRHQFRVWLGNNYSFRFVFPGQEEAGEGLEEDPDYFFAEAESAEAQGGGHATSAGGGGVGAALNHKLAEALRKVQQANIISADLDKNVSFAPKIYKNRYKEEDDIVVAVRLENAGVDVLWPWEKFEARLVQMVQVWQQWQQSADGDHEPKVPEVPPEKDAFQDLDDQRIGEADVWLQSLANMIELQTDTAILTPFGHVEGKIKVEILPCDKNGGTGPWGEDDELDPFVDEPEELVGKTIKFVIKVDNAVLDVNVEGGHGCKYDHVYVRYKFNLDDEDEEWTVTQADTKSTFNPKFGFAKTHSVLVTKDVLARLQKGRIIFQVWGKLCAQSKATGGVAGAGKLGGKRAELEAVEKEIKTKRDALLKLKACPHCGKDLPGAD